MEFDFDCESLLGVDQNGIAILDAEKPPSFMRGTMSTTGFGSNAHR
jgi:hypothetical protein